MEAQTLHEHCKKETISSGLNSKFTPQFAFLAIVYVNLIQFLVPNKPISQPKHNHFFQNRLFILKEQKFILKNIDHLIIRVLLKK